MIARLCLAPCVSIVCLPTCFLAIIKDSNGQASSATTCRANGPIQGAASATLLCSLGHTAICKCGMTWYATYAGVCQTDRAAWAEGPPHGPDCHAHQDMHQSKSLRLSRLCNSGHTQLILGEPIHPTSICTCALPSHQCSILLACSSVGLHLACLRVCCNDMMNVHIPMHFGYQQRHGGNA